MSPYFFSPISARDPFGNRTGAHLGFQIVGGHVLGRRDEDPVLEGKEPFLAAGKKEGYMGVFFRLGDPQLGLFKIGEDLPQDIIQHLRPEDDRKREGFVIAGHREKSGVLYRALPDEPVEVGKQQRPRYLAGPVGPKVDKEDTVAVGNRSDGFSPLRYHRGGDELVGLAAVVGLSDGRHGIRRGLAPPEHDGVVSLLDPIPPLVPIHAEVTPLKTGDLARADFGS